MRVHQGVAWAVLLAALAGCCTSKPELTDDEIELRAAKIAAARAARIRTAKEQQLTPVASYRYRREISMYYSLDLLKDNAHSPAMAAVMRTHDDPMRTCYADRLSTVPHLAGDVALAFQLSKATGTVSQVAHVGGSLSDPAVVSCIVHRLTEIKFRPPYDMQGKLNYRFSSIDRGLPDDGRGVAEPHPPLPETPTLAAHAASGRAGEVPAARQAAARSGAPAAGRSSAASRTADKAQAVAKATSPAASSARTADSAGRAPGAHNADAAAPRPGFTPNAAAPTASEVTARSLASARGNDAPTPRSGASGARLADAAAGGRQAGARGDSVPHATAARGDPPAPARAGKDGSASTKAAARTTSTSATTDSSTGQTAQNAAPKDPQGESKEARRHDCRGCRVQDGGKQQVQTVSQKEGPADHQRQD